MKSNNVYRIDRRFYVRNINKCICHRKYDDSFVLNCKIKERGEKEYSCGDNPKFLQQFLETKKLWLSEEARERVNDAIAQFNRNYAEALGDSFTKVPIEGCQVTLYYRHLEKDKFDFLLDFERAENIVGNARLIQILKGSTLQDMFHILNWQVSEEERMMGLLRFSTEQAIETNPIYVSAVKNDDKVMQSLIKLHYHIADNEDCRILSKNVCGTDILPPLPKEYNRNYCVDKASISIELLNKSGYEIVHSPYFSMQGKTHSKWLLNPHTKYGLDAGSVNEEAITFDEYLGLFREVPS